MNVGARLVKMVTSKTTTATVLATAIFHVGCKAVAAGVNPMNTKRDMDKAVEVVPEDLAAQATLISETSTVHSIASLIGSTTLGPHSPTESRSLVVQEEIDINTLTAEVLQRISAHTQQRKAVLGMGCKEAAVRCENATKHFKAPSRWSRTEGPSIRVP